MVNWYSIFPSFCFTILLYFGGLFSYSLYLFYQLNMSINLTNYLGTLLKVYWLYQDGTDTYIFEIMGLPILLHDWTSNYSEFFVPFCKILLFSAYSFFVVVKLIARNFIDIIVLLNLIFKCFVVVTNCWTTMHLIYVNSSSLHGTKNYIHMVYEPYSKINR